jgi:hypothetical protein
MWYIGLEFLGMLTSVFFFFEFLGLELRAFTLSYSSKSFSVKGFFWDRVSRTIFPGLISASWVPGRLLSFLCPSPQYIINLQSFWFHFLNLSLVWGELWPLTYMLKS